MASNKVRIFLSLANFNQFAFMGIFFKFFAIYLKDLGLRDDEVGLIFMVAPLTHIGVTFFYGYFSNKFQFEERLLKYLTFFSFIFSLFYFFVDYLFVDLLFGFMLSTFVLSLVRTPVLAILDSTTLSYVMEHGGNYSKIRVWGSVGYIFSVLVLGVLRDIFPYFGVLTLYAISLFLLFSYLSSIPIASKAMGDKGISLRELVGIFRKNSLLLPFFVLTFLHMISMACYHVFFGLFITNIDKGLGYPSSYLGYFTFFSVFAEIIFFRYSHKIGNFVSPFRILSYIFLLTSVRWCMFYISGDFEWILFGQLLHSFSWGAFFLVSIRYIEYFFKDRLRTSGISLFSVLVFGLGNILGFFMAGELGEVLDNYSELFFYCMFLSLLTFFVSVYLSRYESREFRLVL